MCPWLVALWYAVPFVKNSIMLLCWRDNCLVMLKCVCPCVWHVHVCCHIFPLLCQVVKLYYIFYFIQHYCGLFCTLIIILYINVTD